MNVDYVPGSALFQDGYHQFHITKEMEVVGGNSLFSYTVSPVKMGKGIFFYILEDNSRHLDQEELKIETL